jgi:protein-L-isoaspartate(D-aspartate) O-methyltransferase
MNIESVRRQMVEQQIRTWDVFDPSLLSAFHGIPRHEFVPAEYADVAYADTEIPLPHGQCMLRPNIVGRMLQAVNITKSDKVLEVGTGTGYVTACLAQLADSVTSIDIYPEFVDSAAKRLAHLGVDNVFLESMDAVCQLPGGKFDAILVSASAPELDMRYVDALNAGGRLFIVVGETPVMQALLVTRIADGEIQTEELFETNIPPIVAPERHAEFSF